MNRTLTFFLMLSALLFLSSSASFSQQRSIRLINPHGMNMTDKATMDSLTVIIKPEGAYSLISYMVNISTDKTRFSRITDTVEIESYFQLPETAIVNDSWLWVEDTLVYADLIDRWTASSIYEDIVMRFRRDPSLFFKNSPVDYEYRLYPLAGTKYRKFLISMMVPNRIENDRFIVDVPDLWFGLVNQPQKVDVIFLSDSKYKDIKSVIPESTSEFVESHNEFLGNHLVSRVDMSTFLASREYSYSGTIKDGMHLSKYNVGNEKYFQMALNMNSMMPEKENVKHLYVFEYVDGIPYWNIGVTIDNWIQALNQTYNEGDLINVIYTDKISQTKYISPDWIEMNSSGIAQLSDLLRNMAKDAATFPSLPVMINEAVKKAFSEDSTASIVLFSSSNSFGEASTANMLLNHIRTISNNKLKFYAIDYSNKSKLKTTKINNINYSGNEYFYYNLAKMNKGEYFNLWSNGNSLNNLYVSFSKSTFKHPTDINYFITTPDGFAYQYFEPLTPEINKGTLLLVGKYVGGDDFTFRMTYLMDFEPHFKEIFVPKADIVNNLKIPQIWIGNHLKYLEKEPNPNNMLISEIIDISMSHRVLSRYTAFLALEPWMRDSIFGGGNENQDGQATDVVDEIELLNAEFSISVNPNPARESAQITLESGVDVTISSIEIYDMKGSIVRHIDAPAYPIKGEHTIFWDLFDDYGNQIQNGTYYIIVNVGLKSFTYKVIVSR